VDGSRNSRTFLDAKISDIKVYILLFSRKLRAKQFLFILKLAEKEVKRLRVCLWIVSKYSAEFAQINSL